MPFTALNRCFFVWWAACVLSCPVWPACSAAAFCVAINASCFSERRFANAVPKSRSGAYRIGRLTQRAFPIPSRPHAPQGRVPAPVYTGRGVSDFPNLVKVSRAGILLRLYQCQIAASVSKRRRISWTSDKLGPKIYLLI